MVSGVGAAVWRLKEIHVIATRSSRWASSSGWQLGAATMLVNLVELPLTPAAIRRGGPGSSRGWQRLASCSSRAWQLLRASHDGEEASRSLHGADALIELRDPKHPLLRQLQQRAPGTYNHSLTLAALRRGGLGGDQRSTRLLTRTSARCHHDIGKMNKPDYFVENQTPGFASATKLAGDELHRCRGELSADMP